MRALALHGASLLVAALADVPYWIGRAAWATSQALWKVDDAGCDASEAMWRASVWLEEQAEARRATEIPPHVATLRRLAEEERREFGGATRAAVAPSSTSRCSGLTASWCPVHGDCLCPELRGPGAGPGERSFTYSGCPLHSPASDHAERP